MGQLERNSNVNSDPFWFSAGGLPGVSGVRVSSVSAMQLSVAYACDRVLSETIAQLPLFVYERRQEDDGRDKNTNIDIFRLLHDQPNPNMTSYVFRRLQQHHINMRGNAYAELEFAPNGRIDTIWPLHPDRITVQLMRDRMLRYIYNDPFTRQQRIILDGNMFHLKGYSDDGLIGLNPVHLQRNALGNAMAGRAYDGRFFKNDAQVPAVVSMAAGFESSKDRTQWLKDWNERHQSGKQHSIELLEFGATYTPTAMSNVDAQFLEGMKYRDNDIARIFKVQPHKVGILDRATLRNIEEQNLEFVQNTILPIAVNWEQGIKKDMIIEDDIFAEFLVEALLRGNVKAQTEAGFKAIMGGWRNRNEQRQLENRNPVDGLDEFLEPVNVRDAGSGTVDENGIVAMTRREKSLAMRAAMRIVNKEVVATRKAHSKYITQSDGPDMEGFEGWLKDFYEGHGEFVSDVMVMKKDDAERYAEGGKNAIIGAVVAESHGHINMVKNLMDVWEIDRASSLANMGVFNNA